MDGEVEKRWCILRHSDSDLIGEIFSGKRTVYNASESDVHPLPPFEFFIPFAGMKQKPCGKSASADEEYKSYDAMLDDRALRNDLHHFIFICAPKEQVLSILDAPWAKALRNRLYAYRDEKGVPIEICNVEMERFKTILKRFDFQIINGEPSSEVSLGDEVHVVGGPMVGSEGKVLEIREREGQIFLTIELAMFQDKMHIAVPGISIADVRIKGEKAQQLLQDPIISRFEEELIELLCHLHGKKGSRQLNREDQMQLRFLYQYSDIVFEDNEENRRKFAALMLICAYLMDDKEEIARRSKEVEALLMSDVRSKKAETPLAHGRGDGGEARGQKAESPLAHGRGVGGEADSSLNEINVYLITALFIVTHEAPLRQQVKAWRQSHPDCSLSLRRFLSIAKQIRC